MYKDYKSFSWLDLVKELKDECPYWTPFTWRHKEHGRAFLGDAATKALFGLATARPKPSYLEVPELIIRFNISSWVFYNTFVNYLQAYKRAKKIVFFVFMGKSAYQVFFFSVIDSKKVLGLYTKHTKLRTNNTYSYFIGDIHSVLQLPSPLDEASFPHIAHTIQEKVKSVL